jgi:hypothetical protein
MKTAILSNFIFSYVIAIFKYFIAKDFAQKEMEVDIYHPRIMRHLDIRLNDYFNFQKLIATSTMVLTNNGDIQEETTFRGISCLILRENTDRPSTIEIGTNTLIPFQFDVLNKYIDYILNGEYKKGVVLVLWDGKATEPTLNDIVNGF